MHTLLDIKHFNNITKKNFLSQHGLKSVKFEFLKLQRIRIVKISFGIVFHIQ